jgi:hypothetical protein
MVEWRLLVGGKIGVPSDGFGQRHTDMTTWLDEN